MDQPKTIEELREWFKERGYEPAKTRFFVGVDFRAPKAFGIYKNEFGEFVVYKNKADGTRAIRYQGDDEEFAVHELYQRFQEEIINQQTRWTADNVTISPAEAFYERERQRNIRSRKLLLLVVGVFASFFLSAAFMIWLQAKLNKDFGALLGIVPVLVMVLLMFLAYSWLDGTNPVDLFRSIHPKTKIKFSVAILGVIFFVSLSSVNSQKNGYYSINNNLYYRAGSSWYHYDDDDRHWEYSSYVPSQFTSSSWDDYQNTSSHHGTYSAFETTSYYKEWRSSNDSNNSHDSDSSSWSSDDWDSGYTDWNSDW